MLKLHCYLSFQEAIRQIQSSKKDNDGLLSVLTRYSGLLRKLQSGQSTPCSGILFQVTFSRVLLDPRITNKGKFQSSI